MQVSKGKIRQRYRNMHTAGTENGLRLYGAISCRQTASFAACYLCIPYSVFAFARLSFQWLQDWLLPY